MIIKIVTDLVIFRLMYVQHRLTKFTIAVTILKIF